MAYTLHPALKERVRHMVKDRDTHESLPDIGSSSARADARYELGREVTSLRGLSETEARSVVDQVDGAADGDAARNAVQSELESRIAARAADRRPYDISTVNLYYRA